MVPKMRNCDFLLCLASFFTLIATCLSYPAEPDIFQFLTQVSIKSLNDDWWWFLCFSPNPKMKWAIILKKWWWKTLPDSITLLTMHSTTTNNLSFNKSPTWQLLYPKIQSYNFQKWKSIIYYDQKKSLLYSFRKQNSSIFSVLPEFKFRINHTR